MSNRAHSPVTFDEYDDPYAGVVDYELMLLEHELTLQHQYDDQLTEEILQYLEAE